MQRENETTKYMGSLLNRKDKVTSIRNNFMPNSHNPILDSGASANYITPNTPYYNYNRTENEGRITQSNGQTLKS